MDRNKEIHLSDDTSGFVSITDIIPDVLLDIRYYSTDNFIGDRIDGYEEAVALLTKEAALSLKRASDEIKSNELCFKIYDAYRPQMAVDHFVRWAEDIVDTRMKDRFYPDVSKEDLFSLGFIAGRSGHSRGSTVDLTLFDTINRMDVDMGGAFDFFGDISHSDYTDLSPEQLDNRKYLRKIMIKHGFTPLKQEWWHYTLKDEPYPDTYFTFPNKSAGVDRRKELK